MNVAHLFADRPGFDPQLSEARAAYVAEVLGVEPPSRLLDDDGAPSPEVMDFVMRTGASLDFIFMGDLRILILGDCKDRLRWFATKGHA